MADPLGIVASLVQLVDTALNARECASPSQEQEKLLSGMDDLRPLLHELHSRITAGPSRDVLQGMQLPLADFNATMEQLANELRPRNGVFLDPFLRPLWIEEVQEYTDKLEKFKALLKSWLGINLGDIGQQHQRDNAIMLRSVDNVANTTNSDVTSIGSRISDQQQRLIESVDDVGEVVDTEITETRTYTNIMNIHGGVGGTGGRVVSGNARGGVGEGPTINFGAVEQLTMNTFGMNSEDRPKIIEWLSPINFFLQHADVSSTRQAGTGGWLLADPLFNKWESSSGMALWCSGIPGAGKTVLASMVIDHLSAKSDDRNMGVACLYLNHKEADTQTPAKLLAGLWRQLVLDRDVGSLATELYRKHRERDTAPALDKIYDMLCSAISEYRKVYVIVDAIDESPETQRTILLHYLAMIMMDPVVNVMITSRPHINPDVSLPNLDALEIRANDDDVRRYVDAQIQISARLSKHVQARPELRDEILSKITDTADGMFSLAKPYIESLTNKRSLRAVRQALQEPPKDLYEIYDLAMMRIEDQRPEDKDMALSALIWVANAKRPLTISEITVALAIEPDMHHLDDIEFLEIDYILSVCAGLITVDEQLSVVRLVHRTTQEYLDSIQAHQFLHAQTAITRTLFTYLGIDEFIDPSWVSGCHADVPPLIEYSQYCLAHAVGQPEVELRNMIVEFLGHAFQWKQAMGQKWDSKPWNFADWPSEPSPLWIAAAANLMETAKFLLRGSSLPRHSSSPEIIVASYYGHLQMVELLVENDSSVPSINGSAKLTQCHDKGDTNIHDIIERLDKLFHNDKQCYTRFLACRGASAQWLVDLLQDLLDYDSNLATMNRRRLCNALIRLSGDSKLHPTCFPLTGLEHERLVAGGSFGDVYTGLLRGQAVAVKMMRVFEESDIDALLKEFGREALIWRQLSHPNLLPFYGLYYFQNRLCLVSPWMEQGNIRAFSKKETYDTDCLLSFILDVALGLEHLHAMGIVHGDLKGDNIFVTPSRRACIADFGLSSIITSMSSIRFTSSSKRTQGGTLRYQAPELHRGGHNDQHSDIYGFASLVYELLAGTAPFPELYADGAVIMAVLNGRRPLRPPSCSGTRALDGLWNLLQNCWEERPEIRPTASQIVERLMGADIRAKKAQPIADWDDASTSRFRRHLLGQRPLPTVLEFERVIFGDETPTDIKGMPSHSPEVPAQWPEAGFHDSDTGERRYKRQRVS